MGVIRIKIENNKLEVLKKIAANEERTIEDIISKLIENYINSNFEKNSTNSVKEMMRMSESSFEDWDNQNDEIYNEL